MPWIESHSVIGRHRKFKGLARQLKISIPQAIGHMHILWHTAIEQAEDGDLSSWTIGAIAESASWEGSEQEFLKAVQDNQLMDGQRIHDWLDYAGKYLTSKYKTSNPEKLSEIWAKFGKHYGKEVNRNSLELPKVSLKAPHLTLPDQTLPNKPEEKLPASPKKHSFEKSKYFDFETFRSSLPDWPEDRCQHYHQSCIEYSGSKGAKYLDWRLAVMGWERTRPWNGGNNGKTHRPNRAERLDTDAREFLAELQRDSAEGADSQTVQKDGSGRESGNASTRKTGAPG